MKRLLLTALLATTSLGAAAQTSQDVFVRGRVAELPAPTYRILHGDSEIYKGAYDLSNGQGMVIQKNGPRLYASVGNQPKRELLAVAKGVFVDSSRQLKLTLQQSSDTGEVWGHMMMHSPSAAIGQASAVTTYSLIAAR